MKNIGFGIVALGLSAGAALAGGIDRSGQGIGFIFEQGRYAELSYGRVTPSVTASPDVFGNIAGQYTQMAGAFKMDVNDKLSLGIGFDQPYGADVFYTALDLGAHLESSSITAIGRYKINPAFSVHGGISSTTVGGWFNPPGAATEITVANDSDVGYLIGAAWEKPEIAARVALTYFSGTTHTDPTSASNFNAPRAYNLDFQTGVAANTLVFGSIRWAEWSKTVITVGGTDVVEYANDTLTYSLGLGRKFNDNWSGAVTLGYEEAKGGTASALSPTDGNTSVGLGATYTKDNMKVTLGVRRVMLGDATTAGLPVNDWADNSATAIGVKVAFTF